jgi:hypothetical protein
LGADPDWDADEPPPCDASVGAEVLGPELNGADVFVAREGAAAGAEASAGADSRAGAVAEALSGADSARAGVASAGVAVASVGVAVASAVVVSVVVESAAADADVASSDAFICANLSPATAVNVAPAKKSAA